MSVHQNRVIIRQGNDFKDFIQFKLPPENGADYPSYEDFENQDPLPLEGDVIRGDLVDYKGNALGSVNPTYHDKPNGIIKVQIDKATTAAMPAVKCFCDFVQDFTGSGETQPLGSRLLFRIVKSSTA